MIAAVIRWSVSNRLLVIIGAVAALFMWRFLDMNRLLQHPRIEVH